MVKNVKTSVSGSEIKVSWDGDAPVTVQRLNADGSPANTPDGRRAIYTNQQSPFTDNVQLANGAPDLQYRYSIGDGDGNPAVSDIVTVKAPGAPQGKAATSDATDYDAMNVADLHALATERNIEGRSELTTHADLVKAHKAFDRKAKR